LNDIFFFSAPQLKRDPLGCHIALMLILRRIRGLMGTALIWAMLWSLVGAALAIYNLIREGPERPGIELQYIAWVAVFYGAWGAISGAMFALVLAAAERRRSLNDLSMLRFTIWGSLAAVALPILYILFFNGLLVVELVPSLALFAVTAGLGAMCAGLTLGLARRAPKDLITKDTDSGSLTSA
jgi:membrane associated rhomboid family serine protease